MKKVLLFGLLCLAALLPTLEAQEVPKRIVVEHFTNSRCGICANRNPGFYSNLDAQEGIMHISFHPSSPYSNCQLHQVNPSENDDRTNFYNIYGGTPRLVIQGQAISAGTNYASSAIFTPHLDQTTPISLQSVQTKEGGQIGVTLIIRAEADNNIGTANLFLGVAEDVVFYNAPNGEDEHRDVFRKTFTGETTGITVDVPATAGESTVVSYTMTPTSEWDFDRLFVMAILQDEADRSVIQATANVPSDNEVYVNTIEANTLAARIFPNPVTDVLQVRLAAGLAAQTQLFNAQGSLVQQQSFNTQTTLDLTSLPSGIYWLEITADGEQAVRRIIKE